MERLEGRVDRVSATDAFAVIAGRHVPLEDVLSLHKPAKHLIERDGR